MREAPSITILNELYKEGAKFNVYDPQAFKEAKWRFENINDSINYCESEYEAAIGADALVLITEWNQFRNLNFNKIKEAMRDNYFFDLRNIYNPQKLTEEGFRYYSVGRGNIEIDKLREEVAAAVEKNL
jgi:UDPglucose 6-dehydrogenase